MGDGGVWKEWLLHKFSKCVWSLLSFNANETDNLEKLEFDHPCNQAQKSTLCSKTAYI